MVNKFSKKLFKVVPVKFQLLPKIVLFGILFPELINQIKIQFVEIEEKGSLPETKKIKNKRKRLNDF